MSEFVLRPGRSAVVWAAKCARASFKVQGDLGVSVFCESETGTVGASPVSLEHEFSVRLPRPTRIKLRIQNASGTRKARGFFEATNG